ncbi:hypothetical protein M2326_002236 [Flavobacterium sp. 7A]|nr:hypothetical protein [Flavobacterium sp. 7A]
MHRYAKPAITRNPEHKHYYNRKVEEGKIKYWLLTVLETNLYIVYVNTLKIIKCIKKEKQLKKLFKFNNFLLKGKR